MRRLLLGGVLFAGAISGSSRLIFEALSFRRSSVGTMSIICTVRLTLGLYEAFGREADQILAVAETQSLSYKRCVFGLTPL